MAAWPDPLVYARDGRIFVDYHFWTGFAPDKPQPDTFKPIIAHPGKTAADRRAMDEIARAQEQDRKTDLGKFERLREYRCERALEWYDTVRFVAAVLESRPVWGYAWPTIPPSGYPVDAIGRPKNGAHRLPYLGWLRDVED